MKTYFLAAVLCSMLCVAQAAVLVTDLKGRAETDGKKAVALMSEIPDGGLIDLAAGAQMVATDLASGREYQLQGAGQFRVSKSGVDALGGASVAPKALPVANLPAVKVALSRVSQGTMVMRSAVFSSSAPAPLLPARTAVLSSTPTLRWSLVEGATGYRVSVFDQGGQSIFSRQSVDAELALPASAGLAGGKQYSWRVEALGAQGRIADASTIFSVVTAESAALLAQIKPDSDASFSRRVLYAAQLQEAGAADEARLIWQSLAKERPDDPSVARLAR